MRVGFAGTPEFARDALQALVEDGRNVVVVLTQPDRPAGRGMKLTPSAVKQYAIEKHIPVLQPTGLKLDGRYADEAAQAQQDLAQLNLDVLVVAAYGLILPRWVLDMPRYGCLNIHGSLLPRWRGAAPIQRAIEAGDLETGITIMQMDEGLDTGDMLLVEKIDILPDDNAQTLHDRLAVCGATAIVKALKLLEARALVARPQPAEGVTYAQKLQKSESLLDLTRPAPELARCIRAFDPFPAAKLSLPGLVEPVKVFSAQAIEPDASLRGAPGDVVCASAQGIDLLTGDGILRVNELQRAGGKRQSAAAFLTGWKPQ